jgi:hypothetical protein
MRCDVGVALLERGKETLCSFQCNGLFEKVPCREKMRNEKTLCCWQTKHSQMVLFYFDILW